MCAITVSIRQAWHVSRAVYIVSSPEWQVQTDFLVSVMGRYMVQVQVQVHGAGPLT